MAGGWWLVAAGCWLGTAGWWLVTGGWWLLAGGYWLVAVGWWLVASGWYLGLALVFVWNSALRDRFNFSFREFFVTIGEIFNLAVELGAGLSFYRILRFS